ncbi:MAG: M20/M25/M40 family metallo-hydrolase [Candidatus Aminicenantaceae bacterium]
MSTDAHSRILDLTEGWEEEQLEFLIALCEQNSFTFHKQGTDFVSEMILEQLKNVFSIHRTVKQTEVGDHHLLKMREDEEAVFLLGHADTVFPPEHPFQTCHREGSWLLGPGTADMKGGLAVMVYALKAAQEAGALDSLNVALIIGADEENGSVTSHDLYESERAHARVCLVGECAGENGEFVTSRNGKAGGSLICTGRDRHVGSTSEEKASAILEVAHKVVAFESLNGAFPEWRINVGRIEGGLGPGTVPAHSSILFDLRWEKEEHFSPLLEKIQEIVSRSQQPQCVSELTLLNHRPAMPSDEKTEVLISLLRRTAGAIGQEVSTEHRRGTSDGNYFGAGGVPTLDGFGPIGIDDHTPQERIFIPSLKSRTALLASLLLELKNSDLTSHPA